MSTTNESAVKDLEASAKAAEAAQEQADYEALESEACEKLLRKAVQTMRKGSRSYSAAYFATGEMVAEYLSRRLALGHGRDAIIKQAEGQLNGGAEAVDANVMIRAWMAFKLLADGSKVISADCRICLFKSGFNLLVERETADKRETWKILPGQEDQARAYFVNAVQNGMDVPAVNLECAKMLQAHNKAVSEAKEAAAKALREEEDRVQKERMLAAEAQEATRKEAARLNAEAAAAVQAAANDPGNQAVKSAADVAKEAAAKADQEKREADEKKAQLDKEAKDKALERSKTEREQKEAEKKVTSATARVERHATAGDAKAPENLLKRSVACAAVGTAKDAAEIAFRHICGRDDFLDSFQEFCKLASVYVLPVPQNAGPNTIQRVKQDQQKAHRAANAALTSLGTAVQSNAA